MYEGSQSGGCQYPRLIAAIEGSAEHEVRYEHCISNQNNDGLKEELACLICGLNFLKLLAHVLADRGELELWTHSGSRQFQLYLGRRVGGSSNR